MKRKLRFFGCIFCSLHRFRTSSSYDKDSSKSNEINGHQSHCKCTASCVSKVAGNEQNQDSDTKAHPLPTAILFQRTINCFTLNKMSVLLLTLEAVK
ncbi:hypothetical protein SODG_006623 [Sodalis praecaptivus]